MTAYQQLTNFIASFTATIVTEYSLTFQKLFGWTFSDQLFREANKVC